MNVLRDGVDIGDRIIDSSHISSTSHGESFAGKQIPLGTRQGEGHPQKPASRASSDPRRTDFRFSRRTEASPVASLH